MKKELLVSILIFAFAILFSQTVVFAKPKIKLNKKQITIYEGQTRKIKIKNKPDWIKVKWTSKNKAIAKVSKKGVVLAKKSGKTTITATINKKKYKCKIKVLKEELPVENIDESIKKPNKKITTENTPKKNKKIRLPKKPDLLADNKLKEQTEEGVVNKLSTRFEVINHRGYNKEAPENTISAFKLSKEKGYKTVETDVSFTKDGVPVLLHDDTINRTARNQDGTELIEPIEISSITYEEALKYDFGIWKSEEYAGEKIPTLEEMLQLCKELDMNVHLELKDGSESQIRSLIDLADEMGVEDKIVWTSFQKQLLSYVVEYDRSAEIGLISNTGITQDLITDAMQLKRNGNKVAIESSKYSQEEIELCKNANIPLRIWMAYSYKKIIGLNEYISGVTVDRISVDRTNDWDLIVNI